MIGRTRAKMMQADADAIAASRLLGKIAEQYAEEIDKWASPELRGELTAAHSQIEQAERATLTEGALYGESFAHAATLTLRKYIGLRKFVEHLIDPSKAGYIALDCRDGNHLDCNHCTCWCHS
jgi:predicted NACHT family NTPase